MTSNSSQNPSSPSSERIMRMRDVKARLGLSESHLYLLISEGRFPKPFPLVPGGRSKGWRESTIEQYVAARESETQGEEETSP